MIDPIRVEKHKINNYITTFGLRYLKSTTADVYFLSKNLLKYYLSSSDLTWDTLLEPDAPYRIVSGLGLTGHLQLGNKLILSEVKYFLQLGKDVELFLSQSDANAKKIDAKDSNKYKTSLHRYIDLNLSGYTNLHMHFNSDFKTSQLFKQINKVVSLNDFQRIYEENLNQEVRDAIIDMAASIINYSKDSKVIVLLGIDEFVHALFIKEVSLKLNLPEPIFLFHELILGYDGNKMGKSRSEFSLLLTNSAEEEIDKVKKFLCKDNICSETCPAYQISKFSEFGDLSRLESNYMHHSLIEIIKKECIV